jgi:hypothetical protein
MTLWVHEYMQNLKNAIFWDVTPCGSCKSRHFGGMYRFHLVTAKVVHSLLTLVNLMMEAIHSSKMSVLAKAPKRNLPEDGILHNHCRENFQSYISPWLIIYLHIPVQRIKTRMEIRQS